MASRDEQSDTSRTGSGRRTRGSYMYDAPVPPHKGGEQDRKQGASKEPFKNPNK